MTNEEMVKYLLAESKILFGDIDIDTKFGTITCTHTDEEDIIHTAKISYGTSLPKGYDNIYSIRYTKSEIDDGDEYELLNYTSTDPKFIYELFLYLRGAFLNFGITSIKGDLDYDQFK